MRILIAASIGLASGFFCWLLLTHFQLGAADFTWAIRAAQDLLAHRNPYSTPLQLYPLPVAIFGLPFVWMRPEIAAGVFYGISSALLAFGLSREGYHRLLIFLAYPYWAGILTAQWPPLIMASAFFPFLLPATLAKPQIGLPVALTHLSRSGVLACIAVLLLSLAIMPRWPCYGWRMRATMSVLSLAGLSGISARAGPVALQRPGCIAASVDGDHAATLVL